MVSRHPLHPHYFLTKAVEDVNFSLGTQSKKCEG